MISKAKTKERPHDVRYPVEWMAFEIGVDRNTLRSWLRAANIDYSKGVTFREVREAEAKRNGSSDARRRKMIAEAETAEIEAQIKRGTFGPISLFKHAQADYVKQQQVKVLSARYLPKEGRVRLAKELAEIQPIDPK